MGIGRAWIGTGKARIGEAQIGTGRTRIGTGRAWIGIRRAQIGTGRSQIRIGRAQIRTGRAQIGIERACIGRRRSTWWWCERDRGKSGPPALSWPLSWGKGKGRITTPNIQISVFLTCEELSSCPGPSPRSGGSHLVTLGESHRSRAAQLE